MMKPSHAPYPNKVIKSDRGSRGKTMAITPSEPVATAVPSSDHAKRGKKKRCHPHLHHQIAWWVPNATTEVGLFGEHVTKATSLSEGENWLICSSAANTSTHSFNICIANKDLHQISGASTGRPFPFDEAFNTRNSKQADDAEESLAGDENRTSNREGVALLCIDVDEKGKSVAVKDIRLGPALHHTGTPTDDMAYDILQTAGHIEFFHARRKTIKAPTVEKKAKKPNIEDGENEKTNSENEKHVEDDKNSSSGESTSGYGTDDEEDGNDELDELNERNELHFYDCLGGLPPPPKETDRDDQGQALYHHPELLPRRQLRVLQHGDRILLRYITTDNDWGESDRVSIVKFEYIYGRPHHSSQRRAKFVQVIETDVHHTSKQTTNEQGKPRLLSVKSADVKSTEKKRRFTLNSTSAAEAPTDDDDDYVNPRKVSNTEMNGHKAGKDWSALGSENEIGLNLEAGKEGNEKNAAQNDGDDDDGGMEEYSYLTGEVVIKDQDYISAITGDEATNAVLHPTAAGGEDDDRNSDTSDGDDAATASAVVLGAVNLPPKQSPREDRNIDKGSNQKDISCPKRILLGTTVKNEEDEPKTNGCVTGDDGVIFEEEARAKAGNSQKTGPFFFTAKESDVETSDDENVSGQELLSPVKSPKKEGVTAVQHTVHFDSEALAAVGKDDEEGDGSSATDYSLTQPFSIPKTVTEQKRSTSSSTAAEENNDADDDDSTASPEVEHTDDEKFEDINSPPVENKGECDEENIGVYDEPTQPMQCPQKSPEVFNESEGDNDYHAETQFEIVTSSKNASISEPKANLEPFIKDKNDPTPVEERLMERNHKVAESKRSADHSTEKSHLKYSPKKQSQTKYSDRKNSRETCDDSAIEKQRLDNSAVHRVQSGAIMTGPVGGAIALASPTSPHLDLGRPNSLVKTAAMLQSIDPNPNPLPDAAASSEETTVCQMDDAMNKNEPDESDHAAESGIRRIARWKENSVISGGIGGRDPNIPTEVCITEKRHDSEITPRHRTSRKRSTPSSGRRKESTDESVRVMFTGITPTRKHKQMIDDIGAKLIDSIEEAASATHVIATDGKKKLRRTPKLMICMCRTSNILSIEWLEQSAKEQKVLDTDDFLLLGDREAEKTYKFSMADTLKNGALARNERGGVLGGWHIYVCSGVPGNKAPPANELKLLIEAAGATLLQSLSEKYVTDPAKTIIITSDPATKSQEKESGVDRVSGIGGRICTTSWLFHTMITQTVDDEKIGQTSKRRADTKSPLSAGKRKSARRS